MPSVGAAPSTEPRLLNCRSNNSAMPKPLPPAPCDICCATCLSNISKYMRLASLSNMPSLKFASRMLFSIISRNSASKCCATFLMDSGDCEAASAFRRASALRSVATDASVGVTGSVSLSIVIVDSPS